MSNSATKTSILYHYKTQGPDTTSKCHPFHSSAARLFIPMPDPSYSSIIFPLASQPSPLTSLKRSPLTVHNRLTSIASDAAFVATAAQSRRLKGRPLVANERCGSWYVPPEEKDGSAYFKSTDGHERAWKFSTRRLNLHLLKMIEEHDG